MVSLFYFICLSIISCLFLGRFLNAQGSHAEAWKEAAGQLSGGGGREQDGGCGLPGAGHGYEGADSAAAREHSIACVRKHCV